MMFVALDENNNKVNIKNSIWGNSYYCQICKNKLVLKKGKATPYHYAHFSNQQCIDDWFYECNKWRFDWINKFPINNAEVILENNNIKHKADILINDLVIIFSHNKITKEEFDARYKFYKSLGKRIAWVFDYTYELSKEEIALQEGSLNNYRWKNDSFLSNYINDIDIYFQTSIDGVNDERILDIKSNIKEFGFCMNWDKEYLEKHQNDKIEIVKLKEINNEGFIISDRFDKDGFLSLFI